MDVFDLAAKITLDDSGYKTGLDGAKRAFSGAAKAIGGAVTAIGAASVALTKTFLDGVASTAAYGDNIDKMSQKLGMSAKSYQEWDAILQHAGSNIESMQAGMKTLASAAETGNDAFAKLGMSMEDISGMSQEELFSATIAALQNVEDETQRTYLASQLLGRGATELGPLLNMSAEEVEALRERVNELGGVMSDEAVKAAADYQDALQDMKTAFNGLSRRLYSNFMPALTKVMNGLGDIFSGSKGKGLKALSDGINDLVSKLSDTLPDVIDTVTGVVESLSTAVTENLPKLLPSIIKAAVSLTTSFIGNLPRIIGILIQAIPTALTELWDAAKETGKNLLTSIGQGIKSAVGKIREWVTNIVTNIGSYVSEHWGDIKEKGSEILTAIGRGFLAAASNISTWVVSVVSSIGTFITENGPDIMEKGENLLGKIWDGFKAAISSVGSWIGTILENMLTSLADGEEDEDSGSVGDSLLAKIGDGFIKAAVSAGTWLLDVLTSIATWIVDHRELIALAGWNLLKAIGKGVANAAVLVLGWMGTIVAQISNWFNDSANIESLKEFGKSIITKIGQGLSDLLADGLDWAGDIFDKVKEGAAGAWDTITQIGSDLVDKIWSGITGKWEDLKAWFQGLLDGLLGDADSAFGQASRGAMNYESGGLGRAIGVDYVPRNNYPAMLHRGEAVLTRQEADAWRSGKSGGGGMTVNIYAQEVTQATVDYIIARADAELGGLIA